MLLSLEAYGLGALVREESEDEDIRKQSCSLSARIACKEAENGKKTHDSEDQREDEAAVTSGVTMIAEVNFDGKFQRGAHEGGRRERQRES